MFYKGLYNNEYKITLLYIWCRVKRSLCNNIYIKITSEDKFVRIV